MAFMAHHGTEPWSLGGVLFLFIILHGGAGNGSALSGMMGWVVRGRTGWCGGKAEKQQDREREGSKCSPLRRRGVRKSSKGY